MQQQDLSNLEEKLNYLENYLLTHYGDTPDSISSLKRRFGYFKAGMKERWSKAHRKEAEFLKNNESWLSGIFELPKNVGNRPGRPSKSFEECSERSKRRKTEEMRSSFSEDAIVHAAHNTTDSRKKKRFKNTSRYYEFFNCQKIQ